MRKIRPNCISTMYAFRPTICWAGGTGLFLLMHGLPRERLALAVGGLANAEAAFEWTLMYVKGTYRFQSRPISKFQHFAIAEMKTG